MEEKEEFVQMRKLFVNAVNEKGKYLRDKKGGNEKRQMTIELWWKSSVVLLFNFSFYLNYKATENTWSVN